MPSCRRINSPDELDRLSRLRFRRFGFVAGDLIFCVGDLATFSVSLPALRFLHYQSLFTGDSCQTIITGRVRGEGNAIGRVRKSVRFYSLAFQPADPLTLTLCLWGFESQGRSMSRVTVGLASQFRCCTDFSSWWRSTVVERRSLAGELSLSCARPAADG